MSNFPNLTPAFTAHISLDAAVPVGSVATGGPLIVAPFISTNSFLRSEPGYPLKVDAALTYGSDAIRQDPSGKHRRLDVSALFKDKNGAVIVLKYKGILNVTPGVDAALSGAANAKTTDFGDVFTHMLFETGNEEFKGLEQNVYVGSGRFITEAGKNTIVEYKISEVSK